MANISMKNLLEAGVHFGHQTKKWNPKMARYIFGERNKIHIIDLQKTVKELKKAYKFLKDQVASGSEVLFVGTKRQAQEPIMQEAKRCGMYYINQRWLGGCLTNFGTIKNSVKRLKYLDELKASPVWSELSKKEISRLDKEYVKLEKSLSGIKDMHSLPEIIIVIDPDQEKTAILESKKLNIPIIAIVDTNCNPDLIDLPVPGNDDAIRAIKLFLNIFADAVLEGKELFKKTELVQNEGKEEKEEKEELKPEVTEELKKEPEPEPEPEVKESTTEPKKEETE